MGGVVEVGWGRGGGEWCRIKRVIMLIILFFIP